MTTAPRSPDPGTAVTVADLQTRLCREMARRYPAARAPYDEILDLVDSACIDRIDPDDPPSPADVVADLLSLMGSLVRQENGKKRSGDAAYPAPQRLLPVQIAAVMHAVHRTVLVAPSLTSTDREYDLLAMYVESGREAGTYTGSDETMRATARRYDARMSKKDWEEVTAVLREISPRVQQCTHPDLIAAANGIVNYSSTPLDVVAGGRTLHFAPKGLHPFDPALVFLVKSHVAYRDVDDLPPVVIPDPDGDWEVGAWIDELFDEPGQEGLADLLWEIIGAILRPHVRWNKSAWFYSTTGSNGKGTICVLLRNLVGDGAHTSIQLTEFSKNFALEPLLHCTAIIVDENDVDSYIDRAANLKAVQTSDVIQIDRKFRSPVAFQFHGFMVQCLNGTPRARDKSESFYRRQLFVPFEKSFTGAERPAIKEDYLARPDVLEYVFWYAVNRAGHDDPGCYYRFSEPEASRNAMDDYRIANDPVRDFWTTFRLQYAWTLLPFTFLYDHYRSWFERTNPRGIPVSSQRFVSDLLGVVAGDPAWGCRGRRLVVRPGSMMDDPEPLIAEYRLEHWYTPGYTGHDPIAMSRPALATGYRGLVRLLPADPTDPDDPDTGRKD